MVGKYKVITLCDSTPQNNFERALLKDIEEAKRQGKCL